MEDKTIIIENIAENESVVIQAPTASKEIILAPPTISEITLEGPYTSNNSITIEQGVQQDTVQAFPVLRGEKGETGETGKSALELFQIITGSPQATWEDYQNYLSAPSKQQVAEAILELEDKINTGYFNPKVEARPETRTWWVNGVDTYQPYLVSIEGAIDPQHFIYYQETASTQWIINHPMNKLPAISVVDTAGRAVVGEVDFVSLSKIVLHFSLPFSGKAILN